MDTIETAMGKKFDTSYCTLNTTVNILYIRIVNSDFGTLATVFSNPEETKELKCGMNVYQGYTKLASIINEDDCLRVCMEVA